MPDPSESSQHLPASQHPKGNGELQQTQLAVGLEFEEDPGLWCLGIGARLPLVQGSPFLPGVSEGTHPAWLFCGIWYLTQGNFTDKPDWSVIPNFTHLGIFMMYFPNKVFFC